jgi:leucyl-tRNA synthetase
MKQFVIQVEQSYEQMRFRDVIKDAFYEFQHAFNAYRLNLGENALNASLIEKFIRYSLMMLYPITPHFCEVIFKALFP